MIISVEGLVKKYESHTALDGLDFEVGEGDIFGFLGPNGAGKTTTIRSPVSKMEIALGKLGAALTNWGIILVISLPYLFVVGKGGQNVTIGIIYLAVLGTLLAVIFSAFSLGLSARIKSIKNSLILSFFIFLLAGFPIFISAALRGTWFGLALDFINPLADALNTFDSVVIDSQGFSFQAGRVAIICGYTVLSLWFLKRSVSRLEM